MGDELDFHTWEMVSAYADGALDEIGAAVVERALRTDPAMAAALATITRQNLALKAWAADIDVRPIPLGVRAMLDRARMERCPCANGDGGRAKE
ncbi:hypothetical protein BAL199_17918 [alpha proteobacterium BAL199]|jgi:anti-sigma factor RsiW|nr:hypothetical protein BAL199_17918 [alpha proteobacterium BAL199]